jgi:adenylate cyclase
MPAHWTATPFDFTAATKVVMVLDVVESVRLMEQDERGFVQRWHQFVDEVRSLLARHGGRMHKSLGDGLMLEFDDAQEAVRAGFAIQAACLRSNAACADAQQMHLRIGAHLCEYVADQWDIYGSDVNLTARIATLAGPGEMIVSAAVRDRLAPVLDADVEDLGDCHLKHVLEPVRAYRIGPAGHAPVIESGLGELTPLRPTIAVIPFTCRSAEPGHELLGEALADEVIAALSRTSELLVISRLSTTVFRDRNHRLDDIRHHLRADYVLSGTCRSAGSQLSLFVELTEARTGHIVWAETLRSHLEGLFHADHEFISELMRGISSAVVVREMGRARSHALPTLEGYTLLLGGIALMHRTSFREFDRARQLFETLAERNRRHPVAHAWLGKWHVLRVQQGWTDDPARETQLALDATRRAINADSHCALAWTVDGFVRTNLMRDLDSGLQSYETALEINPNESLAWLLKGTLHAFKDEGDLAVDGTERALALSPLDPLRYFYDSLAATAAASAGRYDRAIELGKRSLRSNRTHTSTYRAIAIAQAMSGRTDDARETVRSLLGLEPGFCLASFVARSPTSRFAHGQRIVDALRRAGVPE